MLFPVTLQAFSLLFSFIMPSHLHAARTFHIYHLIVSGTSDIAEFRNQCLALDSHGLVLMGTPKDSMHGHNRMPEEKELASSVLLTPFQWDDDVFDEERRSLEGKEEAQLFVTSEEAGRALCLDCLMDCDYSNSW